MKSTRKIIKIDEAKCNGCGICVPSCAEGAIRVIDEMKSAPRLQTGLLETGALGEEPMRLAIEAIVPVNVEARSAVANAASVGEPSFLPSRHGGSVCQMDAKASGMV